MFWIPSVQNITIAILVASAMTFPNINVYYYFGVKISENYLVINYTIISQTSLYPNL